MVADLTTGITPSITGCIRLPSRTATIACDPDSISADESRFFYHDGSERPVQRPIDGDEQEEYYSGKKRCHTVKNILLIRETCDVAYLSPTPAGKWHEKSIAADEQYRLPANSVLYQDMGFQVSRLLALSVGDTRPPGLT